MNRIRLLTALFALAVLFVLLGGCQGNNASLSNPRPRSRDAAGEAEDLPYEAAISKRIAIDSDGGELEYRQCQLTVPRGAVPEALFFEIEIPQEPQRDIFIDSAYQINPDGFEFDRDVLLTLAYFDDDIPPGKEETDVVIVHSVNGIWVELSNTKVRTHNNLVEAPIRFTGLYGLRLASEDPRELNTMPVAVFESSAQPFPGMHGIPLEEARAQPEADQPQTEDGDTSESTAERADVPDAEKVNINTASKDVLQHVPGLDAVVADRIIDYRKKVGPFTRPQDLVKIKGVDAETMKETLPYIKTSDSTERDRSRDDEARIIERRSVAGPEERDAYHSGSTAAAAETDFAESLGLADWPEFTSESAEVTVYFNASDSSDPDGTVIQYDWDFDSDGIFDFTSHSSPFAEYSFRHNGDYSVVLKVTDNGRYARSGYTTRLIKIRNPRAIPESLSATIAAFPPDGPAPHTVNFAATTTGGSAPYDYRWNFSDGSESLLANPFTTYPDVGLHRISFEVTDQDGRTLTGSLNVESRSKDGPATPQPKMSLNLTPPGDRGQAPFKVAFRVETDRATKPVTYKVLFGDEGPGEEGLITTGNTFDHVFSNAGFYLVKVIATDSDLRTATSFATVHAMPSTSPRDFTASDRDSGSDPFSFGHDVRIAYDYTEASPRTVALRPVSDSRNTGEMQYQWDFGDGNFSTESKPVHTYAVDGVFEIRLTADDGMQRFRHRTWLPVSSESPAIAIQRPPYIEGPAPLGLSFDAVVTRGEEPLRYDWEFGLARRSDPGTYYNFQLPGDYEVKLTAYDKWDQPIYAPPVQIKVRETPPDYRQPLAVIQPVAGSTRAVVLDYTAANPLPLSSPHIEGPVNSVKLSADGRNIAMSGDNGLLIKRVNSGRPILSFLPSTGTVSDYELANGDLAFCTVESTSGGSVYLLRPGHDPQYIAAGHVQSVSASGSRLIVRSGSDKGPWDFELLTVSAADGTVMETESLGSLAEAVLTGDGRQIYLIDSESRLVRITVGDDEREFLSAVADAKSGLAVSEDGNAVTFVSERDGDRDIIIGRTDPDGEFRLASITDQTGFFSEQLSLSADGYYLLAYGSGSQLATLLREAGEAVKVELPEDDEAVTEAEEQAEDEELVPQPPRRRERFGVIRMDISSSPDTWSISAVNPRFVSESNAEFDTAGPF